MKTGNIPEKVTLISRKEQEINPTWDGLDDFILPKSIKVRPTFVADNEKSIETGKDWAKYGGWKDEKKIEVVEVENKPIVGVRIIDFEQRSEGGRAWKAVLPGGYLVDIREDVLLDIITSAGIGKDGYLNGKYIFAKVGSQMKLIRYDSKLYKAIAAYEDRRDSVRLKSKDFRVGGVYRNIHKELVVFLGKYHTWVYNKNVDKYSDEDVQLWVTLSTWEREPIQTVINKIGGDNWFFVDIRKTWPQNIIEDTGKVVEMPDFLDGYRSHYDRSRTQYDSWTRKWTPSAYDIERFSVCPLGVELPKLP